MLKDVFDLHDCLDECPAAVGVVAVDWNAPTGRQSERWSGVLKETSLVGGAHRRTAGLCDRRCRLRYLLAPSWRLRPGAAVFRVRYVVAMLSSSIDKLPTIRGGSMPFLVVPSAATD
jgi:hypothetical protein